MHDYRNLPGNDIIQRIINRILYFIGCITGFYYYLFRLIQPTHKPAILLMTCIDYRLIDNYVITLDKLNLTKDYDQFILAGASLAFTDDEPGKEHEDNNNALRHKCKDGCDHLMNDLDFASYQKVYLEHLKLAIDIHHIDKIIVVDHEDCGAYKLYYGEYDIETHRRNMETFFMKTRKYLKKNGYGTSFKYDGYLALLDGKFIKLTEV